MSSSRKLLAVLLALGVSHAWAQSGEPRAAFAGIGRAATPAELAAWDIDVRPDFKGLPAGSGSVAKGQEVWESKCESCHGVFGESNQTFSPLIGGTTAKDVQTGRVERLTDPSFPGRTTMMKVSSVSTLWDYIRRAMPWTQPKSLSVEEVYAVTAYLLNLGGVVADDFTLSDRNIAEVQKRLPNRNGMTTDHAMWPGRTMGGGKPDVKAAACMKDCDGDLKITSDLPDHARNAHGNLAEQNRAVGPQRGIDTTRPPGAVAAVATVASAAPVAADKGAGGAGAPNALLKKHACVACHGVNNKIVGPSFRDVSRKYADRADAASYLAGKIRKGGSGVWGAVEMPAQPLGEADAKLIAQWLADGARP